ncbi:MAG: hypothetical protein NVS3B10_21240 [Polyangiales bacterium]
MAAATPDDPLSLIVSHLPTFPVSRGVLRSGAVKPARAVRLDGVAFGEALAGMATAAASGTGCMLTWQQADQLAIGLALHTVAVQNMNRLPIVPNDWSDVVAARKTGGPAASIAPSLGLIALNPFSYVPSELDPSQRCAVLAGCQTIREVSKPKTTPAPGVTYVGPSIALPGGGIGIPPGVLGLRSLATDNLTNAIALGPAIVFTVGVVAIVGLVHYFDKETQSAKFLYESETARHVATTTAALQAAIERMVLIGKTGKYIPPSPVETAAEVAAQCAKEPSNRWLEAALFVAGGVATAGVFGYVTRDRRERDRREERTR